MLQQYNSQGFPQFVPFGLNPMMNPAAAAMYQQNMNYAFQHHPQQFYLNNNGQGVFVFVVYGAVCMIFVWVVVFVYVCVTCMQMCVHVSKCVRVSVCM